MRKTLFVLLLLSIDPGSTMAQTAPAYGTTAVILGYYISDTTAVPPANLNLRLFTHICHGFATGDSLGNLKISQAMGVSDLVARAHAAGAKVLLSVGGPDSASFLSAIVNESLSMKKFVDGITAFVMKNRYDGVDIDWEYPASDADKDGLSDFVALLRQSLARRVPGAVISLAVPSSSGGMQTQTINGGAIVGYVNNTSQLQPGQGPEQYFDQVKLMPLVDFINVKAYGFHGDWISTGFNSNLVHDPNDRTPESYSVQESMDYWSVKKGWTKGKLVIGIPSYAQQFHMNHITVKENLDTTKVQIPFRDVLKLVAQGWREGWDKAAYASYLLSQDNKEFITYDSPMAAQMKGQWTRQQGFRGVFISDISLDAIQQDNVLAHAARNGYAGVK